MSRVPPRATSSNGGSYPGAETSPLAAMFIKKLLTFGFASIVLGTASGAQSVGVLAALGVGGYVTAVQQV